MSVTQAAENDCRHRLERAIDEISRVILGKDQQIRLALCCLLARGHCLIEDHPGVGKTTLAHAMAQVLGLEFQRIQFTSDLLPADVLGVSVYRREDGGFEFHPGPIFSPFILADEINRATPKTQSALLEAMAEHQVTVEGHTRALPQPFFVIATQNPSHQLGTYELPESQLDRFLMRLSLGYPDAGAERELLEGEDRRLLVERLGAVFDHDSLLQAQQLTAAVHVSPAVLDYVQAILRFSRQCDAFANGLSPRGGLALINAARAWALINSSAEGGDGFVLPEHIQAVLPAVVDHRLPLQADGRDPNTTTGSAASLIIESVAVS